MLEVKQTLEGSKSSGARFGYAIANVNDMNRDGYNGKISNFDELITNSCISLLYVIGD
jgi:hypothetical protein